jgi:hypothetical protein
MNTNDHDAPLLLWRTILWDIVLLTVPEDDQDQDDVDQDDQPAERTLLALAEDCRRYHLLTGNLGTVGDQWHDSRVLSIELAEVIEALDRTAADWEVVRQGLQPFLEAVERHMRWLESLPTENTKLGASVRQTPREEPGPPAETLPPNHERDAWILERWNVGWTRERIRQNIPPHWQQLETEQAVTNAVREYSRRHGLFRREGKSGRPRK